MQRLHAAASRIGTRGSAEAYARGAWAVGMSAADPHPPVRMKSDASLVRIAAAPARFFVISGERPQCAVGIG